jgi:hypothetical protein
VETLGGDWANEVECGSGISEEEVFTRKVEAVILIYEGRRDQTSLPGQPSGSNEARALKGAKQGRFAD